MYLYADNYYDGQIKLKRSTKRFNQHDEGKNSMRQARVQKRRDRQRTERKIALSNPTDGNYQWWMHFHEQQEQQ